MSPPGGFFILDLRMLYCTRVVIITIVKLKVIVRLYSFQRYSFENPNMVRFQEYMQLHEIQYLILMTMGKVPRAHHVRTTFHKLQGLIVRSQF